MSYKMIAVDLDGTLLNAEKKIPERAKNAIIDACVKGAIVILCTGRTRKGALRYYKELGLDTLLILSGGAEVLDPQGKPLFTRYLNSETAKQILVYASELRVHAQVYIDDELIIRERNAYSDLYEKHYGFPARVVPDLLEKEIHTPKVLLVLDVERIPEIRAAMINKFPNLSLKRSETLFLEFSDPEVDKGKALNFVADYYGIRREEIIAVGDSEIDVSMLEFAGLAAAVNNADCCAKESAEIICPSNEHSGVADLIEEYFQ